MSVATDVQVISVPCGEPDCDYIETGPATGRGSAPFKIGSHRWNVHGVKKDGTRREPKHSKTPSNEDKPAPARVLSVVSDVAGDVKGEGVPTQRQLERAGAKLLQVGTAAFASVMAETEDGLTEAERDEIEDTLTLTSSQANEMVSPLARVAAPSKINKRFGRTAVDVAEVAAPVAEVTLYAITVARYLRDRRRRREVNLGNGQYYQGPTGPPPTADPHNPGGTATPAEVVLTGGNPTAGMVIDPSTAEGRRLLEQARRG